MWYAIQEETLEYLICGLFDIFFCCFCLFSTFYLISLENRAELICSPAVSLSLNCAGALFLRIIFGLYSPSCGHSWALFFQRREHITANLRRTEQSQASTEPFRETCVFFVVQKIHSESTGLICVAIHRGIWNVILVKEAILHYWHSSNVTWSFLPVQSWVDFMVSNTFWDM